MQQQVQYSKTVLRVTRLSIVTIPSDYFELSNSSGCFVENGAEPYESFNITIRNRYNQTINIVNASLAIIPDDIVFMDGYSSFDYYVPQYFYEAGPTNATPWTFPIRVQMFGAAYGQNFAQHTPSFVPFDIAIYIQVGSFTEGPLFIGHDLEAKYNAPSC